MKWTSFMYCVENKKNNEVILFNTLNKSVIALEDNIYSILQNNPNASEFVDIRNELINQEFLIDDNLDEKENFIKSLDKEWNNHDAFAMHFLPTTNCNFRCSYCYQDGIERTYSMSIKDIDLISRYIDKYFEVNPQIKYFVLTLHGGEPTLGWGVVPYALESFKKICDKNNIKLITSIVSNTYLLDEEKANLLSKYGWFRLQTTIDGPEEIHNSRRCLKNGEGSYKQIMRNLKYILDNNLLQSIDLRINYDQSNYEYTFKLIDEIASLFDKKRIFLSFGLITQTLDSNAALFISKNKIESTSFDPYFIKLYKYANEKGFYMLDSYVFGSMCTAKMKNSMIVSPDGYLYKCLSMVGRKDGIIGDWKNDGVSLELKNYFLKSLYDECFEKKCALIPICQCDCRFDALINKGDFLKKYCRKSILDKINKEMLLVKYGEQ